MTCIPVTVITTDAALENNEHAVRKIYRIIAGGQHNE
jgi:hypothetical protein